MTKHGIYLPGGITLCFARPPSAACSARSRMDQCPKRPQKFHGSSRGGAAVANPRPRMTSNSHRFPEPEGCQANLPGEIQWIPFSFFSKFTQPQPHSSVIHPIQNIRRLKRVIRRIRTMRKELMTPMPAFSERSLTSASRTYDARTQPWQH